MTYGTEFDNGDDRSSSDNNKQHDMNEDVVITKEIITWGFILPPFFSQSSCNSYFALCTASHMGPCFSVHNSKYDDVDTVWFASLIVILASD